MTNLPSVITPMATPKLERSVMFLPITLTKQEITELVRGEKFAHFWGFVTYRDVFYAVSGKERKTTFHYAWEYFPYNAIYGRDPDDPRRQGSWHQTGPDDNQET